MARKNRIVPSTSRQNAIVTVPSTLRGNPVPSTSRQNPIVTVPSTLRGNPVPSTSRGNAVQQIPPRINTVLPDVPSASQRNTVQQVQQQTNNVMVRCYISKRCISWLNCKRCISHIFVFLFLQENNESVSGGQTNNDNDNDEQSIISSPGRGNQNLSPPPDDSGPDDDGVEEEEEEEETFLDLFENFSRQWLHTQLTHHVSLTASNAFWTLAMKLIPHLFEVKTREGIKHKIPQFLQVLLSMIIF